MAEKDLKYFLDHPDEMPTDPAELERLANEQIQRTMESGKDEVTVDRFVKDEKEAAPSPAAEVKEEPAAETPKEEAPKAEETQPEGVLAKDGKNVIPYGVLEAERRRTRELTDVVAALQAEVQALKAPKEEQPAQTTQLNEEELQTLEAEWPTMAKVLRGLQNEVNTLRGTVGGVANYVALQANEEETEVKSEIQQAIDANPTLSAWQNAEDQTMWNEAAKQDLLLRQNPLWADVPWEKRFEKVVELTQSAMQVEAPAPKPEDKPNLDAVRAAAQAKLQKIATMPRSLSQIPGGAPPAVDERQKVEEMSPIALGEMFLHMTPEQREVYLQNL